MARYDERKQRPFFWKNTIFWKHTKHTQKAIANTPALEHACVRGVLGVYVEPGHVRTAATVLYIRAEVPLISRARTQTFALSLDTKVTHDQPKSM